VIASRKEFFTAVEQMRECQIEAINLIINERKRQDGKWGDQPGNHPFEWMSILMEEVGELAEAVNETYFKSEHTKHECGGSEAILKETIQVAAVATAIAEAEIKEKRAERARESQPELL
jgi:NTP pyrophosphatase (non-canonical NTP hydrolase)